MQHHNYIKLISSAPIPCIICKTDNKNKCTVKVSEINDIAINLFNVDKNLIINTDIVNLLGFNLPELLYPNNSNNFDKLNIHKFIPKLRIFYKIDIINLEDNNIAIWLTESYKFDNYILSLLDRLDCIAWIKDINGTYLKINKEESGFIGKTTSDIFSSEELEIIKKDEQKLINNQEECISKLVFLNGKCYDTIIYPIYDNHKIIIGTIGFANEVSNIITSNAYASSQKRMLELIGDNIPDQVFYKDTYGKFLYCNESFAKAQSLKKTDIIGKNDFDFSCKDEAQAYRNEDNEVMKNKKQLVYESQVTLKNGKSAYMETIKVPFITREGIVGGVLGISRNISIRKETEFELDRLRMEFFANLSHEFRTPLNLIFSSIQIFDKKLSQIDNSIKCLNCSSYSYQYLDIIKQNAFRLLRLVNNLIDSTKLDVGSLEFNPINYDIVAYAEYVFQSVVYFAKQNNIEMIFDTTIEEKLISFDLDKMERIILNLLSNAIKFNKENGKIYLLIDFDDDFVTIEVKDTGIGIPSDKLNEVFEKFKQVNNRFTKISEGSGIGLSLVKSLVELHNGTVHVDSILGEYTSFLIKIPNININSSVHEYSILPNSPNIDIEFSDIY